MQRSDFTALPPAVALGIVWDALHSRDNGGPPTLEFLEALPVPEKVRAPKYDFRIGRKGGFQWASETDLEGLRFWHARAAEGAASGGQWAEKDAKREASLARWIAYREQDPTSAWSGVRDDAQVTAPAPMSKPLVREYDAKPAAKPAAQYGAEYDAKEDDDALPF